MFSTTFDYQRITKDLDRTLQMKAQEPFIKRETDYYLSRIGEITSIDEFLEDTRVFNYAMKAFGLEEMSYAKAFMRKVLTEGVTDPNSFANKLVDKRYREFAQAFNFARYGEATTEIGAQQGTANYYTDRTADEADVAVEYYLARIGNIETVDDFLAEDNLYRFAMTAWGLEDKIADKELMRQVLTEGIDDPGAIANQLSDDRFRTFAQAFNFARYGAAATDSLSAQKTTTRQYETIVDAKSAEETDYYLSHITEVKSPDAFFADSRLFNYAMKAYWLEDLNPAFVRDVLEGGAEVIEAVADKLNENTLASLKSFAETFNFKEYGADATTFEPTRQGTVDNYLRQTLEIDAGAENEGVRLALYFERLAPTITSPMSILADKALMKFVQVAFSIPESASSQDIDKQAALIEKRLNVEDLKDPEKLKKLIIQFTSMWELSNPSQPAATPNILISQPLESGFSSALMASLQNLKRGGF